MYENEITTSAQPATVDADETESSRQNRPNPRFPALGRQPDDYVKDGMEWLRNFVESFEEKLGSFIKAKTLMLARIIYYVMKNSLIILVAAVMPIFAWMSLGELLVRYGSVTSISIGATIILIPVCVFSAHAWAEIPNLFRQEYSNLFTLFRNAPASAQGIHIPDNRSWSAVIGELKNLTLSSLGILYRFFHGEQNAIVYYYVGLVGGAMVISASMFLTPVGLPLSNTWFGTSNLVLARVVFIKVPELGVRVATDVWNGTVIQLNRYPFQKLLGIADSQPIKESYIENGFAQLKIDNHATRQP